MEAKTEPHEYQWIINEGLLRDEGILFGLAGAVIEEKMEAIRDYYRIKKAASQTKREQLEKEVEELGDGGNKANSGDGRDGADKGKMLNLVPAMLQLCLYGGVCYFNFYLECYWLSPVIDSIKICVGLYLFGLFSVFMGRSIMYNSLRSLGVEERAEEHREKWKIYLEELGVPLVVSLFIAILPAKSYPLSFSVLAGMLFFLLFLFGGKGLVNTFHRLRREAGGYFGVYREWQGRKRRSAKLRSLEDELSGVVAILMQLDGEEEYKLHILTSEYKLAFENRQLAGNLSVKKLA